MCTAITYQPRELYMGRSLDYEASYGEELVVLPRRFPLRFRHGGGSEQGYAILGTAHVADGYPLYYDAVNEKGLGIAGLNFVGNARYAAPQDGRQNVGVRALQHDEHRLCRLAIHGLCTVRIRCHALGRLNTGCCGIVVK